MEGAPLLTAKDSIPRVQHVVYFQCVLEGVALGLPFDELRRRLRTVASEQARVTAARVEDAFSFWSPTAEALGELMRLGLIENRPLPSKRAAVDGHRDALYVLTPEGRELSESAGESASSFKESITPRLIERHPYLSGLCRLLGESPLLIPEYTEESLREFRQADSWTLALATDALAKMQAGMPVSGVDVEWIRSRVLEALAKRHPEGGPTPTSKAVLDTVLDALVAIALRARGLPFDAVTFNVLMSWGRQLFIFNESRYVLGRPGRSVWATATVELRGAGRTSVSRRGYAGFAARIADELPCAYRDIASGITAGLGDGGVRHPYVEIFRVRALAAFRVSVADSLVDRVMADVADEVLPAPYRIEFALGQGVWTAVSETPFLLGDRRYYVMLIKDSEAP
ncbi:hypothetical protein D7Y23_33245 [Corallococcus sp. AB050B]|nr:hypothetical protein D7Y23_33245 [Corallococcus sp. AB050B]